MPIVQEDFLENWDQLPLADIMAFDMDKATDHEKLEFFFRSFPMVPPIGRYGEEVNGASHILSFEQELGNVPDVLPNYKQAPVIEALIPAEVVRRGEFVDLGRTPRPPNW